MPTLTSKAKIEMGSIVEWKSQAGGFTKKKRGEVVARVAPGQLVNNEMWAGTDVSMEFDMPSISRAVESWLVRVEDVRKGRAGLYWPPPGKLTLVSAPRKAPSKTGSDEKVDPVTPPGFLPGIPDTRGPLDKAAENYLEQAARVKQEKKKLSLMGQGVMSAMQSEKRLKLTLAQDGDAWRFEVLPSGFHLKVIRSKE